MNVQMEPLNHKHTAQVMWENVMKRENIKKKGISVLTSSTLPPNFVLIHVKLNILVPN